VQKRAEPIDLPFVFWTRVGRKRRHKFNRIRQVAHWRHLANTIELVPIDFAVWVVVSDGPKKAQVQWYSAGGTNVPS